MTHDQILAMRMLPKEDAPPYYRECVGCVNAHHPENLYVIGELDSFISKHMTEIMGDEPDQEVCSDCLFVIKVSVGGKDG